MRSGIMFFLSLALLSAAGCSDFYSSTGNFSGTTGTTGATGTYAPLGIIHACPTNTQEGIPHHSKFYITFNNPIENIENISNKIELKVENNSNGISLGCTPIGWRGVEIDPGTLTPNTNYTLIIKNGVTDVHNQILSEDIQIHFKTGSEALDSTDPGKATFTSGCYEGTGMVHLEWVLPADDDLAYVKIDAEGTIYTVPIGINQCDITNLNAAEEYEFKLTVYNSSGKDSDEITTNLTPN